MSDMFFFPLFLYFQKGSFLKKLPLFFLTQRDQPDSPYTTWLCTKKKMSFAEFLGFGAGLDKWYLFLLSRRDIHENWKVWQKRQTTKPFPHTSTSPHETRPHSTPLKDPIQAEPDIALHQLGSPNAVAHAHTHRATRRGLQSTLHCLPLQATRWYINCWHWYRYW